MKTLTGGLFLVAVLAVAQAPKSATFKGVITDGMCANGDHSGMRMGANDAECAKACVEAHGAQFVLYDGKAAYVLSDQKTPEKFAGQKVAVIGKLDAKTHTIQVESITK